MTTTQPNHRFFSTLFFLLWTGALFGQFRMVGAPEIINFSKSEYHAGTQNWCIVQDDKGIIYIGNNKGLLIFDGTTWQTLQLPNRTIVRSLAIDPDGRILVGGQDEFGLLKVNQNGRFAYHSLVGSIPAENRSFEDLWKIFPTPAGVFFCSQRVIFIWKDDQFEILMPQRRFENFFELNGEIYVQDHGVGLTKWNGHALATVPQGERFAEGRIAAILPKDASTALLISDFAGLFLLNGTGVRPWETASSSFLKNYNAYCAVHLKDGKYAVGTVSNGLLIMDNSGRPELHLNKESGLQNNTVLHIFQDQRQNLWLGMDNGIDYAKTSTPFTYIRSESGVEGTGYASFINENRLYFGTNQGLYFMDWVRDRNPFEPSTAKITQAKKGQVWSLQQVGGKLVAGMHEGTFLTNGESSVPLPPAQGAWKFMELAQNPGFAVCGTYTGILLYQKLESGPDGRWVFRKKLDGFDQSARVMEEDAEGNIWVSHAYKGLYKISFEKDPSAAVQVRFFTEADGLPTNISINVAKVKGEVVFTTTQGFYFYDAKSDRFLPHQNFNEILGGPRHVYRIMEDQTGNIWYSVDNEFGLLQIDENGFLKGTNVVQKPFNHIQGELVDGFENVFAFDEHNVFIATEKGFIHYNPSFESSKDSFFHVLVRKVEAIGKVDSLLFGGNWPTSQSSEAQLSLPASMKSLRFSFSAPSFEHLDKIEYRYKLEGFNEGWSEWSRQVEKDFTNLPHGEYTFQVEAMNTYGQVSEPAVYRFEISPPWYATSWAKFVYVLLAGFLVMVVLRYFSKKLEQEKTAILQEKDQALELKEAKFKIEKEQSDAEIVRLRNENLRSDIKHKNAQLAAATMHLVQKGEILLKIKNELSKLPTIGLSDTGRKVQQLVRLINENIQLDDNWEQFEVHFDQVHENFLKNLRHAYPNLTPKDQKLCAYLRMNLTTKEIAPLMNISVRGVEISRYRLRKKLELETDVNLVDFIMKF